MNLFWKYVLNGAVKKISAYITRKVADKLNSLFKKDRKGYEEKWNDIKLIIEYGMLSEEKFFEKSKITYAIISNFVEFQQNLMEK